jgi:hypothetical protein
MAMMRIKETRLKRTGYGGLIKTTFMLQKENKKYPNWGMESVG